MLPSPISSAVTPRLCLVRSPTAEGQPGKDEAVPSGCFLLKLTVVVLFFSVLKEKDSFQLYRHPELADHVAVGMPERQAAACACR